MSLEDVKLKLARPRARVDRVVIWDEIVFDRGRVHEICGPARHSLAAWSVGRIVQGAQSVFWISPHWHGAQLHFAGLCAWMPPQNVVHVRPRHSGDIWWCAEEILRSGTSPVLVIEAHEIPHLTQVRRLHLAAQHGAEQGAYAPIGLILTDHNGGVSGVESRYFCHAQHTPEDPCWRIERRRARTAAPKAWELRPNAAAHWHLCSVPLSEMPVLS